MNAVQRVSPLHQRLVALAPRWNQLNGMRVAEAMPDDMARLQTVALADLSALGRAGLKGPGAAAWLQNRGVPVPRQFNTWRELPGAGLVARLAATEFFIEDGPSGSSVAAITGALQTAMPGVYPVPRQDAGLALAGRRVNELLRQTCSYDFEAPGSTDARVVMTMMAGVAVLVVVTRCAAGPCHRIWCDPGYAPYLWDTLVEIAGELGGGAVGTAALLGTQQI